MIPKQTEVLTLVNNLLGELKSYAKERFDVNVDNLKPKLGFRETKRLGTGGSKGGEAWFKLNLGKYTKYQVAGFVEYKSFTYSTKIGGFKSDNWEHVVAALVIHEFAHVIQYALQTPMNKLWVKSKNGIHYYDGLGWFERNHGSFFQRIYAILREKFLNHKLTDIGWYGLAFVATADQVEEELLKKKAKNERRTAVVKHELVGRRVTYKGQLWTIVGFRKQNRRCPWIAVNARGNELRMDERSAYKLAV